MAQVGIADPLIDFGGNCGNISSGVGPFAIDEGFIVAKEPETVVRIYNTNTKKILKAYVSTRDGKSVYVGDYSIDGVPGTGSKILLDYSGTGGTLTGKLLPTGNPIDMISVPGIGDLEVSVVDAANPTCFLLPEVLGFSGIEGPQDSKVIQELDNIELIRGSVAKMIGLAEDAKKARIQSPTRPMIAFVSPPAEYTSFTDGAHIGIGDVDFVSRLFFMQTMHKTYPGTGTVCTGAAAMIDGTIVHRVCSKKSGGSKAVRIGHPSGVISLEVEVENKSTGPELLLAAFGRTSRRIMEGHVYVPEHLF
jgi:2-methylaconitate cis-trans-isomerase PrpF